MCWQLPGSSATGPKSGARAQTPALQLSVVQGLPSLQSAAVVQAAGRQLPPTQLLPAAQLSSVAQGSAHSPFTQARPAQSDVSTQPGTTGVVSVAPVSAVVVVSEPETLSVALPVSSVVAVSLPPPPPVSRGEPLPVSRVEPPRPPSDEPESAAVQAASRANPAIIPRTRFDPMFKDLCMQNSLSFATQPVQT
jgi:hypothetical protein